MKDFFISYTSADRSWAEWIAWELEQAKFSVVIQAWDFRPGSNFVSDMKTAAECERTIAVYSPNYLSSGFTEAEWTSAFAQKKLLPIRVRECEIPNLLKPWVYIDLVNRSEQAARRELVQGLDRERIKPKERPGFPPDATKPKRFPGAPPAIWNVLTARNPNFTGRDEMLQTLHDSLTSGRAAAITQAIAGLGGVGKTQLALEYAYRYASEYTLVWWVSSEQPTALASDYARLATKLDLPEKDAADQRAIIEAVRDWLTQNTGWLLVFDNVPAPADCETYRPHANTGHILITSRNPAWRGIAEPMILQKLAREESIAFIQKRTGKDDRKSANTLSDAVGDLPLALEHAGAYIDANGITLPDYVLLLQSYAKDLLEPVEATWRISFDKLQDENPAALDPINLIAFMAPDNIPRDLVQSTAPTPIAFNKSVKSLLRYSLIETGDATISVHRLVQQVTRERLDEEGRRKWAETAVKLVDDEFPTPLNYRNWPACSKLLPHALATTKYAEELGVALESTSRLLNQAGLYESERAQFNSAETLCRRSLEIGEKVYAPDHPNVATLVNNLAQTLKAKGDLDGALRYAQRALEIDEKAYGPDQPDVAIDANNIGQILQAKGDLDGALRYTQRALEIFETAYSSDHPNVATLANNLGQILEAKGDNNGALLYAQRALEIDEKAYGPDQPDVAIDANNIGQILKAKGDLDGALSYIQRALKILESTYGPDHPLTKKAADNLRILEAQFANRQKPARPRKHGHKPN